MGRERQISEGIKTIKDLLGRFGQKRIRYHRSAAEDDLQKLRALEGLCGHCERVKVRVVYRHGRKRADIGCEAGHSPVVLYNNTPMVKEADCPDFTPSDPKP